MLQHTNLYYISRKTVQHEDMNQEMHSAISCLSSVRSLSYDKNCVNQCLDLCHRLAGFSRMFLLHFLNHKSLQPALILVTEFLFDHFTTYYNFGNILCDFAAYILRSYTLFLLYIFC